MEKINKKIIKIIISDFDQITEQFKKETQKNNEIDFANDLSCKLWKQFLDKHLLSLSLINPNIQKLIDTDKGLFDEIRLTIYNLRKEK